MDVEIKWTVDTRLYTFHFYISFHSNVCINFLLTCETLNNRLPKIEWLETTIIYLAPRFAGFNKLDISHYLH